jgi:hypothetical protein
MKAVSVMLVMLVVILVSVVTVQGQTEFAVGPRFGMNFASCSLNPDVVGVDKGGRTGIVFGAIGEVGFQHMFYVVFEPQYIQKGFSISGQGGKATYAFNYMDLPVYFKVKFLHGKVRPYAFLGPDLGIKLSANVHTELTGQSATDVDFGDVIGSDFSLNFGGGVEYAVAPRIAVIGDLRYMLGLKSVYSNANQPNQTIKTGGLVIMFGALFAL